MASSIILPNNHSSLLFFLQCCVLLAPISSWCLYLAPISTIHTILRQPKIINTYPLMPYTTMVISNFLWLSYGFVTNSFTILIANGTGFLLGVTYFVTYVRILASQQQQDGNPNNKSGIQQQQQRLRLPAAAVRHIRFVLALIFVVIWMIVAFGGDGRSGRSIIMIIMGFSTGTTTTTTISDWLGSAGLFFSICMFASPLISLKKVIQKQSSQSISWSFTLASIANNLLWGIVGYYHIHDNHITIQGIVGFTFAIIQLAVKMYFYSFRSRSGTTKINKPAPPPPLDGGGSGVVDVELNKIQKQEHMHGH